MTTNVKTMKLAEYNKAVAETVMISVNKLVQQRQQFEQNEYARSNACLYEIQTGIYSNYKEASSSRGALTAVVKAMKEELQLQGARVQTNTTAIGLFVRYVFRTDRQRAYNYTCALQAAMAADIAPANLAQYFAEQGGIEECKKQFAKSEKTLAKEQTIATDMPQVEEFLHGQNSTCIAEFDVAPEYVAKTCGEEFTFLLAKADSNGHVQVVSAVPTFSKMFAKWAKEELAVFLAEQQAVAAEQAANYRVNKAIANAVNVAKENNPATTTVGELLGA
jgi:hypothetical protein